MNQSFSSSESASLQELSEVRQQYLDLETEYHRCKTELALMQAKADRLEEQLYLVQDSYDLMLHSSGHRLLEKYYTLRRLLRPSVWKESIMSRLEPLLQKLRHWNHKRKHTLTRDDAYLIFSKSTRIDILADAKHTESALQLQALLQHVGINCEIYLEPPAQYQLIPYLILSSRPLSVLPEIYAAMYWNGEIDPLRDDAYLHGAYAVFATSLSDVDYLSKQGHSTPKLFYLPICSGDKAEIKFYLYRFLMAVDCITFDLFFGETNDCIHLPCDRICLSLPETVERRASFDADNRYGFEVFPGLKHHLGWVGCGLSYKYIFRKAQQQQMESILICEDDTYFPEDFDNRFQKLQEFTAAHTDWDVFSGVMADMGDVTILDCIEENGEDYVYLDKIISTVFNLYRSSMYPLMAEWDNMNRNKKANAIDRYMEDKNLRILTTCPFLVGHKEDMDSTIWNHKNDLYNPGIISSSKRLFLLVDKYKYLAKHTESNEDA